VKKSKVAQKPLSFNDTDMAFFRSETMKVAVYSTKHYDQKYFEQVNARFGFELVFFDFLLSEDTAKNAAGCDAVCIFVNDECGRAVLEELAALGIKYIALRCAGFNNVDLQAAAELGMEVVRVPAYSPEAVAEHTVGMMLALNRRIHRAYQRTRDANFSLDGLTGFNMHNKTAGVVGTGKIGVATLRILKGFGMKLLACDPYPSDAALELGAEYVDLKTLFARSDVITLHCPMTPENHHMLNAQAFSEMKDGVMIINTSRGGLIDSQAAIEALKQQKIGSLGMDVYENERDLFFEDKSNDVIQDDIFRRLSACHNVLFTGHQAFLTAEALTAISETTLGNLQQLDKGEACPNRVKP
jgi:D-lactate dehydrogenase